MQVSISNIYVKTFDIKYITFYMRRGLTVVIFKSRSTFFGLLRKSLRGKSKLKMRLILAIFGEFVRFFENSKNQKVQTLGGATFGDTPMY